LFFQFEKDSLTFYFNKVDLRKLKATLLNLNMGNLYEYLFKKINSIRSYGVNSGARVFLTYNDEIKVRNKAGKSKKRQGIFYAKPFSKVVNKPPEEYLDNILLTTVKIS